jgi:hypothetical protein
MTFSMLQGMRQTLTWTSYNWVEEGSAYETVKATTSNQQK